MTNTVGSAVDALRAAMAGQVLQPGDPDYNRAALIWNGAIDRSPAVVARCASPADVAAALQWGQESGIEIAVRGGGHNVSGAAVIDGGLTIDLGLLTTVVVDPLARRARCGGGATLAQLDAACQEHGLAVPAGTISHTGVAGLTLGGGFGWLSPMAGLTIDNLISVEVVLVDGRVVRASTHEHPDLFWALRGGGGNFGVVTEFEFQLHPVGPLVHLGMFFFELDRAEEAIRLGRKFFGDAPRNAGGAVVGLNAPPAPFVPEEAHFAPGVALVVAGFGAADEHARMIAPLREAEPLFELVTPMPYVAMQQMLDEGSPWGVHAYTKGLYLDELADDAVDVVAARLRAKSSPMSQLLLFPMGGAFGDVPDEATAFGGRRSAKFAVVIDAIVPEPGMFDAERQWARSTWEAVRPFAADAGTYVNMMSEFDEDRVRVSYGAKYERLSLIKTVYDPRNVLHANANIKPA
ncbi:FAD-binding oxidoreductase [Pseudonocardia adelaidensis]|uniref:FAD-binding oxidoreductase n=1 Tax=Pseudonocardia adelaidensis TaxID=648754 RepID=A0ABP9NLM5_9PSEU